MWASPVALVVKNPPANAGDIRDMGSIPGSGRSPGGGHGNPCPSITAWRTPWTEEPGGLWSIASQSQTRLKQLSTRGHTKCKIYRQLIPTKILFLLNFLCNGTEIFISRISVSTLWGLSYIHCYHWAIIVIGGVLLKFCMCVYTHGCLHSFWNVWL